MGRALVSKTPLITLKIEEAKPNAKTESQNAGECKVGVLPEDADGVG
jgi:hypothetical protein